MLGSSERIFCLIRRTTLGFPADYRFHRHTVKKRIFRLFFEKKKSGIPENTLYTGINGIKMFYTVRNTRHKDVKRICTYIRGGGRLKIKYLNPSSPPKDLPYFFLIIGLQYYLILHEKVWKKRLNTVFFKQSNYKIKTLTINR